MNAYRISSTSGVVYGIYEGDTPEEAFRAMARDGGADPDDPDDPVGRPEDWIIEEIDPVES
jgi:hypothetical protein